MLPHSDPCTNPVSHKSAPIGRNIAMFNNSPGGDLCKKKHKRSAPASMYNNVFQVIKKVQKFCLFYFMKFFLHVCLLTVHAVPVEAMKRASDFMKPQLETVVS